MLFCQRLRGIRNEKNLSQKEFAALLDINAVTLSHYENGKREPDLERFVTLCQKLSVSADYLLGLSDTLSTPATPKTKKLPTNGVLNVERPRSPLDGLTDTQLKHVNSLIDSFIAENEALIQADLTSKQEA